MTTDNKLPTFRVRVGEEVVEIDISDISGLEWQEVKKLVGLTPKGVLEAAAEIDFDALGALAWVVLKRTDPHINFNTVLRGMSLGGIVEVEDEDEDESEASLDPTDADA